MYFGDSKSVVLYRGKNCSQQLDAILKKYKYFRKVTKKHFNKNPVTTVDDERSFKNQVRSAGNATDCLLKDMIK